MKRHLLLSLVWLGVLVAMCFIWFSPAELAAFGSGFVRGESPGYSGSYVMSRVMYDIGGLARVLAIMVSLAVCVGGIIHHIFEALRR